MNILDYAIAIDKKLLISFNPRLEVFQCLFEGGEIKEDKCLVGKWGYGRTPLQAINHYTEKIQNSNIVFSAMDKRYRKEHRIPELDMIESF